MLNCDFHMWTIITLLCDHSENGSRGFGIARRSGIPSFRVAAALPYAVVCARDVT